MSSSHDITLTPQEQALIMRLKSFRVPEMAHILEEQLKDPNADLNTFMERMTAMVDAEWQARADKRFNRLMKEAHLRYPAADLARRRPGTLWQFHRTEPVVARPLPGLVAGTAPPRVRPDARRNARTGTAAPDADDRPV